MTVTSPQKQPSNKLFRILRNTGLAMAGISGAILTAPVTLPAALLTVAGYVAVAAGVLGAISQLRVEGGKEED